MVFLWVCWLEFGGCRSLIGLSCEEQHPAWPVSGGEGIPEAREPSPLSRRELFISYSHHDVRWLEHLRVHLRPLERLYGLQRWDDSRIKAGDKWLQDIEQALSRARVALLLVSPQFLASDFIEREELPPLFDAAQNGGLKILWVPLRPCNWKLHPQIEQYQAVFPPQRTLADMSDVEQDRIMVQITETIQRIVDDSVAQDLASREAAAAEALARRQSDERRREEAARNEKARKEEDRKEDDRLQLEEEARLQRVEKERQDGLKAEREARAEAERWRAEAERLAKEKEELRRQAQRAAPPYPMPAAFKREAALQSPPLIQLPTTRGWLVRVKKGWLSNAWQLKKEALSVSGYEEVLAEGIALKLVQIPAGEFQMGSPADEKERFGDEGPQHLVRLRSFFLGQTPVTQAQWKVVAGWPKLDEDLNPDPSNFKGANRPVESVSWKEAVEFCRRLSLRSKREYTLPSEAQWEYACRAGTTTPFAFGETISPELANYDGSVAFANGPTGLYRGKTTPVGSFPANDWGLHDMHGNVWEWCLDQWHDKYQAAPVDGRAWVEDGSEERWRLLRGGSWINYPRYCRSACRVKRHPVSRGDGVGFRLCVFPPGLAS